MISGISAALRRKSTRMFQKVIGQIEKGIDIKNKKTVIFSAKIFLQVCC